MRRAIPFLLTIVLGVSYIWFGILGERPLQQHIRVTMDLPDSYDLRVGGSTLLRGIKIGEVERIDRSPGRVRITLAIETQFQVPVASAVKIEQLSAFGEVYVNLEPHDKVGPYFTDGQEIAIEKVRSRVSVPEVFDTLLKLTRAVDAGNLGGVLQTLKQATEITPDAQQNLAVAGRLVSTLITSRSGQITALSTHYGAIVERLQEIVTGIRGLGATGDLLRKATRLLEAYRALMDGADLPNRFTHTINPMLRDNAENLSSLLAHTGSALEPLGPVAEAFGDVAQIDIASLLSQLLQTVPGDGGARLTVVVPPQR